VKEHWRRHDSTIDLRPGTFKLSGYSGDTIALKVVAPAGLTDGRLWNAHVKRDKTSALIDAVFLIYPPEVSGGPAYLVLGSEDTTRLSGLGPVIRRRTTTTGTVYTHRYSGFLDCQLSSPENPDPKTTIFQASITIDLDVTRP
jgi:hypothetical protein